MLLWLRFSVSRSVMPDRTEMSEMLFAAMVNIVKPVACSSPVRSAIPRLYALRVVNPASSERRIASPAFLLSALSSAVRSLASGM